MVRVLAVADLHGHIHPEGRPGPDRGMRRTTIRNVIPHRLIEIRPVPTPVG